MGFDDQKVHDDGRAYSGMAVGGTHDWTYPDGRWRERKVAPDRWEVRFESAKVRRRAAPVGSGAQPGTGYHWLLLAHQRVRKVDADVYQTLLEGTKWKIAHRRPHWRRWSSEYPEQTPARERVIAILEETLARLRAEKDAGMPPIEDLLTPVPDPRARPGPFVSAADLLGDPGGGPHARRGPPRATPRGSTNPPRP